MEYRKHKNRKLACRLLFVIVLLMSFWATSAERELKPKILGTIDDMRSVFQLFRHKRSIFLLDNLKSRIRVYELQGGRIRFIHNISRQGQGPGDLQFPSIFSFFESEVCVADNIGYSIFGRDGKFHGKFRRASYSNSLLFLGDRLYTQEIDSKNPALITVYSRDGKILFQIKKDSIGILSRKKMAQKLDTTDLRTLLNGTILRDGKRILYFNNSFATLERFNEKEKTESFKTFSRLLGENARLMEARSKKFLDTGMIKNGPYSMGFKIVTDVYMIGRQIYMVSDADSYSPEFINKVAAHNLLKIASSAIQNGYHYKIVCVDSETGNWLGTYRLPVLQDRVLTFFVEEENRLPVVTTTSLTDEGMQILEFRVADK